MAEARDMGATAIEPPMYTTLSKGGQSRASPQSVLSLGGIRTMANVIPVLTLGIMGGQAQTPSIDPQMNHVLLLGIQTEPVWSCSLVHEDICP